MTRNDAFALLFYVVSLGVPLAIGLGILWAQRRRW